MFARVIFRSKTTKSLIYTVLRLNIIYILFINIY